MSMKNFGGAHIGYIVFVVICTVLLIVALKKHKKHSKAIGVGLVAATWVFVLIEYIGRIVDVQSFNFFDNLPINTFQIFAIICLYILLSNNISWQKFAYLIILPVSFLSVIFYPNLYSELGSLSLATVGFFLTQIPLMAFSVLSLFWKGENLEKRDIIGVSINYVVIIAAMHLVNVFLRFSTWAVHSNYMGTMGDNYDMFLNFVFGLLPVPLVYMLPHLALLIGVEFLLILPFDMFKSKKDRQRKLNELISLGNAKIQQANMQKGKSQVIVRSQNKAKPAESKDATKKSSNSGGFVSVQKEVRVNNNSKKH